MGGECLEFGAEEDGPAEPAVVEWLLAEPIAGEPQAPLAPIPQRDSEHAVQPCQRRDKAPARDGLDEDLAVAPPPPCLDAARELAPQSGVVVDFTVEGQGIAAAGREHGLMPGRGPVDDGETTKPQRQPGIFVHPDPRTVRPAMPQARRHAADDGMVARRIEMMSPVEKARETAHGLPLERAREPPAQIVEARWKVDRLAPCGCGIGKASDFSLSDRQTPGDEQGRDAVSARGGRARFIRLWLNDGAGAYCCVLKPGIIRGAEQSGIGASGRRRSLASPTLLRSAP